MRHKRIACIVLFTVIVLLLAFSLPAGAFDGAGVSVSPFIGTGSYSSGLDGIRAGEWNPSIYPYQQWQNPLWDNRYPFWDDYRPRGFFSDCYSRCIARGYGTNYCAQVCPV